MCSLKDIRCSSVHGMYLGLIVLLPYSALSLIIIFIVSGKWSVSIPASTSLCKFLIVSRHFVVSDEVIKCFVYCSCVWWFISCGLVKPIGNKALRSFVEECVGKLLLGLYGSLLCLFAFRRYAHTYAHTHNHIPCIHESRCLGSSAARVQYIYIYMCAFVAPVRET